MNAECATLHLLSMGVPPQIAEVVARWLAEAPPLCLVYNKHEVLVQIDRSTQAPFFYSMRSPMSVSYGDQVVWHPRTGFDPAFRHPEEVADGR